LASFVTELVIVVGITFGFNVDWPVCYA